MPFEVVTFLCQAFPLSKPSSKRVPLLPSRRRLSNQSARDLRFSKFRKLRRSPTINAPSAERSSISVGMDIVNHSLGFHTPGKARPESIAQKLLPVIGERVRCRPRL